MLNGEVPPKVVRYFDRVCKQSAIFDEKCESNLPKFQSRELMVGGLLGIGGFCKVSEVSKISLSDYYGEFNVEARKHMANNYLRNSDARYAIKKLRTDIDEEDTYKGIYDLAVETKFLSVIDHPHIIKIRAIAPSEYLSRKFFIIIDRLYNTLEKQIEIWGELKKSYNGNIKRLLDLKGKKKKKLFMKRVNVGYDISSAVNYLHKNGIIYRDLATDNTGFDVRGEVKIFDFGLAKELSPSLKLPDGRYKLTGYTGSLRYMAPEVVLCQPYNESADVFSFGVLLWQIISCETPYEDFNVSMYEKIVVGNGYRPSIKYTWPRELIDLMESCWSTNPKYRPTMEEVKGTLKTYALRQAAGKQIDFDDDLSIQSAENKGK